MLVTNDVATAIIGCAMRVHTELGPGLFESVYEEFLAHELTKRRLEFRRQVTMPMTHDGHRLGRAFTADLIVENLVLVEIKCVAVVLPIHKAQVLTYLRITGLRKGLLLNFNCLRLKHGLHSIVRN